MYTGGPLGTVIVMPIAGYFSGSKIGWSGVFYLLGAIGFAWTIIWVYYGLDSPSQHNTITPEELRYIQDGTAIVNHKKEVCMFVIFIISPTTYSKCYIVTSYNRF